MEIDRRRSLTIDFLNEKLLVTTVSLKAWKFSLKNIFIVICLLLTNSYDCEICWIDWLHYLWLRNQCTRSQSWYKKKPSFILIKDWLFGTWNTLQRGLSKWLYVCLCVYIYKRGEFNKFHAFFVQAFKIVVDSGKFSVLLLYILWDDWPIFMISSSKEQLQQELEYTLLKPDCHSWWISKMQSGPEDTLEERYAIKVCFKLGKNARET